MNSGLTAEYFSDPAIFDRESERIFTTHWLCAARADDVRQSGSFIVADVENSSLLIIRGTDGKLRACHNVCRHRGAILREENGNLEDGCVTCSYHAWAYDQSGGLVRAPNMQQEAGFVAADFGLHPVECAEWNGYVMVRLGAGASFDESFAPIKDKFAPWGMGNLVVAQTLEYDIVANWKLLFHNYSECYHCPTVHPALNRLTPYKSAENDLLAGAFLGGPMQLGESAASMTMDGKAVARPLPGLDATQARQVSFYTVCPTMFISPHPDFVLVHRIERVATDRTRVRCEFLLEADAEASSKGLASAVEFWDMTNRQDWRVCELVQKGAHTRGFTTGIYSPLETVLPLLDEYYLEVMNR